LPLRLATIVLRSERLAEARFETKGTQVAHGLEVLFDLLHAGAGAPQDGCSASLLRPSGAAKLGG